MTFSPVYIFMYNYASQIPYLTVFSKKLVRIEYNKKRNEIFIGISFRYGDAFILCTNFSQGAQHLSKELWTTEPPSIIYRFSNLEDFVIGWCAFLLLPSLLLLLLLLLLLIIIIIIIIIISQRSFMGHWQTV